LDGKKKPNRVLGCPGKGNPNDPYNGYRESFSEYNERTFRYAIYLIIDGDSFPLFTLPVVLIFGPFPNPDWWQKVTIRRFYTVCGI